MERATPPVRKCLGTIVLWTQRVPRRLRLCVIARQLYVFLGQLDKRILCPASAIELVAGDAIKPRDKCLAIPQRANSTHNLDPHILKCVGDVTAGAVQPPLELPEHLFEGRWVAVLATPDQSL